MSEAATLTTDIAAPAELAAATTGSAIFDLGYRTRIRVTGEDRLRWLNGMVSNAIQTLAEGHGNYNFILNAQGRILGDAYIYRAAEHLLIDTDRLQASRLFLHLDHFIIMDDVELHPLDEASTAIGVNGPNAAAILGQLGLNASALAPLQFSETTLAGSPVTLVRAYSVLVPRYELWFHTDNTTAIRQTLKQAGAASIGSNAVEALRILEGIPRYGVDITDRHLPQETSQTRALNFTKGCYLGQEIVERIRSRATVHRTLRQFALKGATPGTPTNLRAVGDPAVIGQLTSVAEIHLPGLTQTVAIGFIRTGAIVGKAPPEYDGGAAAVLDHPPTLPQP